MAAQANGNIYADLARLNEEAERAGCALACKHESADELHSDMIRRYFALHPRRRHGHPIAIVALAAFLILL